MFVHLVACATGYSGNLDPAFCHFHHAKHYLKKGPGYGKMAPGSVKVYKTRSQNVD